MLKVLDFGGSDQRVDQQNHQGDVNPNKTEQTKQQPCSLILAPSLLI
jgi:hypothetical protein